MTYTNRPIFPHSKVRDVNKLAAYIFKLHFQDQYSFVQGRVYRAGLTRPKFVKVIAQDNGMRRFAFLSGVLGGHIQPHIWNLEVTIVDRRARSHRFLFFFKNHSRLPINQTVENLMEGCSLNGDVVILRGAARSDSIVNMRGHDAHLADFALRMCAFCSNV